MATKTLSGLIKSRYLTETQYLEADPILSSGEIAVVTFPNNKPPKIKVGDGIKKFSELPYVEAGNIDGINIKGYISSSYDLPDGNTGLDLFRIPFPIITDEQLLNENLFNQLRISFSVLDKYSIEEYQTHRNNLLNAISNKIIKVGDFYYTGDFDSCISYFFSKIDWSIYYKTDAESMPTVVNIPVYQYKILGEGTLSDDFDSLSERVDYLEYLLSGLTSSALKYKGTISNRRSLPIVSELLDSSVITEGITVTKILNNRLSYTFRNLKQGDMYLVGNEENKEEYVWTKSSYQDYWKENIFVVYGKHQNKISQIEVYNENDIYLNTKDIPNNLPPNFDLNKISNRQMIQVKNYLYIFNTYTNGSNRESYKIPISPRKWNEFIVSIDEENSIKLPDINVNMDNILLSAIDTDIYLLNMGDENNKIYKYNTLDDTYTELSAIEANIKSACVIQDKIYYVTCNDKTLTLYEYNPKTNTSANLYSREFNFTVNVTSMIYDYGYNIYMFGQNNNSYLVCRISRNNSHFYIDERYIYDSNSILDLSDVIGYFDIKGFLILLDKNGRLIQFNLETSTFSEMEIYSPYKYYLGDNYFKIFLEGLETDATYKWELLGNVDHGSNLLDIKGIVDKIEDLPLYTPYAFALLSLEALYSGTAITKEESISLDEALATMNKALTANGYIPEGFSYDYENYLTVFQDYHLKEGYIYIYRKVILDKNNHSSYEYIPYMFSHIEHLDTFSISLEDKTINLDGGVDLYKWIPLSGVASDLIPPNLIERLDALEEKLMTDDTVFMIKNSFQTVESLPGYSILNGKVLTSAGITLEEIAASDTPNLLDNLKPGYIYLIGENNSNNKAEYIFLKEERETPSNLVTYRYELLGSITQNDIDKVLAQADTKYLLKTDATVLKTTDKLIIDANGEFLITDENIPISNSSIGKTPITFQKADNLEEIVSGDSLETIMGKLAKYYDILVSLQQK